MRLYLVTSITLILILFGDACNLFPARRNTGTIFPHSFFIFVLGFLGRSSLWWRCRKNFAQNAFEADSGNLNRCTRACRTRMIQAVRIVHVLHAPSPAHQRLLGALSAQREPLQRLAPLRVWHAWSERSWWCAFGKPTCTCLGSSGCCRPRRHVDWSFFAIVQSATFFLNMCEIL